jgi:hypothetical protein
MPGVKLHPEIRSGQGFRHNTRNFDPFFFFFRHNHLLSAADPRRLPRRGTTTVQEPHAARQRRLHISSYHEDIGVPSVGQINAGRGKQTILFLNR